MFPNHLPDTVNEYPAPTRWETHRELDSAVEKEFENLKLFRNFTSIFAEINFVFFEIHVSFSKPFVLLDGPNSGAHKMNVARSPSTFFSTYITLLFCTETLGQRCQKEGSLKAICEVPKPIGQEVQAL